MLQTNNSSVGQEYIAIFWGSKKKRPTAAKTQLSAARNDVSLFGALYVGCVARGGDMDAFFKHEKSVATGFDV